MGNDILHTSNTIFQDVSLLIKDCHEEYFAQTLYNFMCKYVKSDELTQIVYEYQGGRVKPFLIHQDNCTELSTIYQNKCISRDDVIRKYLTTTYKSDPFFKYAQTDGEGIVHLEDIMNADFENTECHTLYYQTLNWKHELGCLVRLSDTASYALTFANIHAPFQSSHVSMLSDIFPVLKQLLIRFWQENKHHIIPNFLDHSSTHSINQTILDDMCTKREKQVIALMMSGLNNTTIAERLGISVLTLKTHRRNIYEKLQINSPIQLMRILLKDSKL